MNFHRSPGEAGRTLFARIVAVFFLFPCAACVTGDYLPGPIDRTDLPLKITRLRGHVYLVEDTNYWRTNTVFYADPRGIVFINATWTSSSARRLIFQASLINEADFLALITTSFGLHHTGGMSEFQRKDIKIYVHELTRNLLIRRWGLMQAEMKASFGSWRPSLPAPPDGLFRDRLSIHGGDVLVLHPGGAHSPDNLVVFFPREKILYGGSLLADPPMFNRLTNPKTYGAALEKLGQLDFDLVVSGHGRPLRSPALIEQLKIRYANFRQPASL